MIYTRFGSPVNIIDYEPGIQEAQIQYQEEPDFIIWVTLMDLKADGGIREIRDACRDCTLY